MSDANAAEPPQSRRRTRTADLATISLCLMGAWIVAWVVVQAPADDAWITLRYARNLIEGNGWCYEPGVAVNASTSAASTVVHAVFGWMLGDLEAAQMLVFTLGLGGTAAILALWLGRRRDRPGFLPGVIAAALVLTTPMFWTVYGMETPLLLLGAVAAACAWHHDRLVLAAGLASFTTLVRPEGVLLPAALLIDRALRQRDVMRLPWASLSFAFAAPLLAWAAWSWFEFGAVAPNTLAAKQAQAQSLWQWSLYFRGAKRSLTMFDARELGLHHRVFVGILLTGIVWLAIVRHRVAALLGWIALVNAGYVILVVPYYHWYAAPLHLGFTVTVAAVFESAWRGFPRARWIATGLVILLVVSQAPRWQVRSQSYASYWDVAAWLDEHAAPDDSIGAVEIGCIGYATWPRRIVDACGLVTPDLIADVAAGRCAAWIERHRPEFVVLHVPPWEGFEQAAEASPTFTEYREVYRAATGDVRVVRREP